MAEQRTHKPSDVGSSPTLATRKKPRFVISVFLVFIELLLRTFPIVLVCVGCIFAYLFVIHSRSRKQQLHGGMIKINRLVFSLQHSRQNAGLGIDVDL